MSSKIGKHGFYIRDMGKVQEIYDNKMIEMIFDKNLYGNFEVYKQYIENNIVLDLGSHIGCMTKRFSNLNAKKIICVEPNQNLLNCLKKNVSDIPYEKIEILEGAVDVFSGITTFYEAKNNSGGSTIEYEKVINHTGKNDNNLDNYKIEKYIESAVNTFSIYELIEKYSPSVVKMDIECTEWKILQNPLPSNVKFLIIEWHNCLYPKYDVRKLPDWINEWKILYDHQKVKVDKMRNGKLKYNNSGRDMITTNVL